MARVLFCLALLLFAPLTLGSANEASRVLDPDLKTWSRLKRDAGYYTESGLWRGGLYKKARSTETEQYRCLNHTHTHCTGWNVSGRSSEKHETGTCACKETTFSFCQQWTCKTQFDYFCTDEKSVTCVAEQTLKCDCIVPASNGRYCWKWHCREDSTKSEGYPGFEDYECIMADRSEEFCSRWHGNTSSKYSVESSACECFERGESLCNHWQCRERGIERCAQTNWGWCRIEIAIGVGGGMGLLSLACCMGTLFMTALRRSPHKTVSLFPVVILACECFERGESLCNHWQCRERGIERCAQTNWGWCRIEIAIGVGGGMGLLSLACCMGNLFMTALRRSPYKTVSLSSVVIFFTVFCLPWFVGVTIWGGIFGMPWVLLVWSIGLFAAFCAVKFFNAIREEPSNSPTEHWSWKSQHAELSTMKFRTKPVEAKQNDISNCV